MPKEIDERVEKIRRRDGDGGTERRRSDNRRRWSKESSARRVLAVGTADRSGSRNYIRRGENESTGKRSQGFADQIHEE